MNFSRALLFVAGSLVLERRVSYRRMRKEFGIEEGVLEDVRHELIFRGLAVDQRGEGLVLVGEGFDPSAAAPAAEREGTASTVVSAPGLPGPVEVPGVVDRDPAPEAERRQLTVMFCDLAGSTALSTKMDPEDLRDVITRFQDACRRSIERYDGFIARYMGDGMLVYFGYPRAHENDAERAVRAGLEVVGSMGALNAELGTTHGVVLAVRVGVATGPVVVGDLVGEGAAEEAAVVGETPNLAARLQGVAQPNQVVISAASHRIVSDLFTVEDLGTHDLKGISQPTAAWRVAGVRDAEGGGDSTRPAAVSPLIGRQEELGLLGRAWEASRDGHGQVVLIQGEAGVGKSRLLEALRERLVEADYVRVTIRCSPYHVSSTLYPVIEHLKRVMDWQPDDDEPTRLEKLEKMLGTQSLPLEEVVPLYADLMSLPLPPNRYPAMEMTPAERREATLDAIVGWLLGLAETKPVLQLYEDLHWADPTTLELLGLYIDQSPTVSMLSVLTFRPEFAAPWPLRSHMTPISLNRLERPEVEAFVAHLSAGKRLPAEVLEHIVAKSDGVPLYVEELTKTIIESGTLTEEADRYRLEGALADLQIPSTLQDSLMARLDRTPTLRQVAQMAAVLGREFAYEMLKAVVALEERVLQSGLEQLVGDELLYKRGRGQRSRYIFKHALIQDAAYQSLLKRTRQQYHRQVAELLEARFPELVETQPELLGHHFTGAGLPERAIEAWERAAQRALERSANEEAIAYFYQALSAVDELSPSPARQRRELGLRTAIAGPLITIRGYGHEETGRAFARAQELSAEVGASEEIFPVLYGRWVYGISQLRYGESIETARQFTELANQQAASGPILMAHRITGLSQFVDGQLREGHRNLSQVVELYDEDEHASLRLKFGQDPCAAALAFLSLCSWQLGHPAQAQAALGRSLALAERVEHVNTAAYVQVLGAAILHYLRGDHAALTRTVAAVKNLAQEHRLAMWGAMILIFEAWLMARDQGDKSAVVRMEEHVESMGESMNMLRPFYRCMLAEAQAACGEPEAALGVLDEAIAHAGEVGEHFFAAESRRLRAEAMLSAGQAVSAVEDCLQESLRIARAQEARAFELRSATSLARLWSRQGRGQEARELIAPVYEWFEEGFDTPDLLAAKALLEQAA